jgi:hypothetical protein
VPPATTPLFLEDVVRMEIYSNAYKAAAGVLRVPPESLQPSVFWKAHASTALCAGGIGGQMITSAPHILFEAEDGRAVEMCRHIIVNVYPADQVAVILVDRNKK